MIAAVLLSLLAALLFAVASVLQQRGTSSIADEDALGAGMLASLAKRPVWVAGIVADIAGFGVQAAALAVGSLLLVQPLLVTTLLFALPMAARTAHRNLTSREWLWSAVLVLSLVLFILMGEPSKGLDQPSFRSWLPTILIVVPLVAGCVFGASGLPHGTKRSLVLAIAAGALLGVSAPLTKTAIAGFDHGFLHGLRAWEFWGMALTAALGTFWQQSSYQAGDVQTSLPAVTVLKPIIAMALGLTIYDETLKVGGLGDLVLFASILSMAVATVMLGRLAAPHVSGASSEPTAPVPSTG
ncbi:MAG: DMT family transporter [Microthrixaceae bacterium]